MTDLLLSGHPIHLGALGTIRFHNNRLERAKLVGGPEGPIPGLAEVSWVSASTLTLEAVLRALEPSGGR